MQMFLQVSLNSLKNMPNKPAGEIYSSIGLHKHGKTLFYRDFIKHLKNVDLIIEAPGTIGLVMLVITFPLILMSLNY